MGGERLVASRLPARGEDLGLDHDLAALDLGNAVAQFERAADRRRLQEVDVRGSGDEPDRGLRVEIAAVAGNSYL